MVHTFSLLGQNIAVDVNSGAVHILDEITYHVLRQMEEAATPLDKIIAAPQYTEGQTATVPIPGHAPLQYIKRQKPQKKT